MAVVAVALLVLLVTGIAVWRAAHTDDASRVDQVDVILVLGAAQYDGVPSPVFEGRLRHAALLYREGRADTIMVLGGAAPGDRSTEADAGRDWLISDGRSLGRRGRLAGGNDDAREPAGGRRLDVRTRTSDRRSSSRIPGTTCA